MRARATPTARASSCKPEQRTNGPSWSLRREAAVLLGTPLSTGLFARVTNACSCILLDIGAAALVRTLVTLHGGATGAGCRLGEASRADCLLGAPALTARSSCNAAPGKTPQGRIRRRPPQTPPHRDDDETGGYA